MEITITEKELVKILNEKFGTNLAEYWIRRNDEKEKIYQLVCPDCENELYDGTLKEIKAYVKNNYYDEEHLEYDNADEGEINLLCTDCARLMS